MMGWGSVDGWRPRAAGRSIIDWTIKWATMCQFHVTNNYVKITLNCCRYRSDRNSPALRAFLLSPPVEYFTWNRFAEGVNGQTEKSSRGHYLHHHHHFLPLLSHLSFTQWVSQSVIDWFCIYPRWFDYYCCCWSGSVSTSFTSTSSSSLHLLVTAASQRIMSVIVLNQFFIPRCTVRDEATTDMTTDWKTFVADFMNWTERPSFQGSEIERMVISRRLFFSISWQIECQPTHGRLLLIYFFPE